MSSARPIRRRGIDDATSSSATSASRTNAIIFDRNGPGAQPLTVMCYRAAGPRAGVVSMCTAALLAADEVLLGLGDTDAVDRSRC